jgi:outer membrane protein assembly factor BamB
VSKFKTQIWTGLLFVAFACSLAALALHIFPELQPAANLTKLKKTASRTGRHEKVAEIPLGKVEIRGYKQMGSTPGLVRLSPDGARIVVGTESGEVMLLDTTGNRLWSRKIGMGRISALEFSRNNRRILVGENSQQGAVICIDARNGAEIWRKASADELGVDIRRKTFPGIMSIKVDAQDNVYAVALRSIRYPSGKTDYSARVYRFAPHGTVTLFPREQNIDVWVSWCGVTPDGDTVAFATSDYTPGPERRFHDNIYAYDIRTGELRWSLPLVKVPPYDRTNMRFGPEISVDGQVYGGVSADGRAFLVSDAGRLLWSRTLSAPQLIQGVYVNAMGHAVQHVGEFTAFSTGNTYNRANWQLPTPVEHPQSNSVFMFDRAGRFLKRRQLGGMVEELQAAGQQLVVAVGRNIRTKDPAVHGMMVMTAPGLEVVDFLPTDGPCVTAVADPVHIVGLETPLQLDSGEVVGQYRLHIWRRVGGKRMGDRE